MTRAAIAALALLLAPAPFAQGQEPASAEPESISTLLQQNSVADVYERAMSALPKDDLSWVAIRSVVGAEFWDNAAEFLPERMLKAVLPKVGTGAGRPNRLSARWESSKRRWSQAAVRSIPNFPSAGYWAPRPNSSPRRAWRCWVYSLFFTLSRQCGVLPAPTR